MPEPRLTIVVPTHDRPALLPRALDSIIRQTVPVRVIIADNGDVDRTRGILRDRYAAQVADGTIRHLETNQPEPWNNWRAGAEAVETDFMAFLQDDDVVSDFYAERVLYAFDEAEKQGARPLVWFGCLDCADASGTMSIPMAGNGPWVPMRGLYGICEPSHWRGGQAVAASMLLTSWSLSPALAYRTDDPYRETLRRIQPGLDMYVERLMPAYMAIQGGFIADPAKVGLWVQHGAPGMHLSHEQWPDQPRQTKLLIAHLDDLLDTLPGWREQFTAWCGTIPPTALLQWSKQLDTTEKEGGKSRHGQAIRDIMWDSIEPRCRITPMTMPLWRRAANWAKSTAAGLREWFDADPNTVKGIIQRLRLPTDKDGGSGMHSYGEFYDRVLAPYRGKPVRLLEIGVFAGGSLKLWREYFGVTARITGLDPQPHPLAAENAVAADAMLLKVDAYDENTPTSIVTFRGPFDIVIDDGPHTLESQIAAIRLYAPRLAPGGMLIIEDVQHPLWMKALAAVVPEGYTHESVDLRDQRQRYDDLIFLVRAPESQPATSADRPTLAIAQ